MSRPSVITVPPPPSHWRIVRAARRLIKQGLSFPARQLRKRSLQAAYRRGSANAARNLASEDADPIVVETGRILRQQVLAAYEGKHAAAGYRVLMLRPGSITAEIWFGSLQSCMQHAGIDCRVLPPHSPSAAVNAALEEFQPNVLIAVESTVTLQSLDLPFIYEYKRRRGCLRLFVPVWLAHAPDAGTSRRADAWRRSLRRKELLADAHFSIFEPEFYERFMRDRQGPDTNHVTVAQACNPFTDQPLPDGKRHDYFMATSLTDERLEVTYRFLRPILARYRGLWAGAHWGFGRTHIPPADMPVHYSQTRIALSPLVSFVSEFGAELTHRVFAAAGCGTFQLTVPTAITGRYFRPDELIQARSPAEYVRLFEHYVDRPSERNAVALCALRRAYAEHTCFHRVDQLVRHWDTWRTQGLV
jgi:glycosyl transferase family 1